MMKINSLIKKIYFQIFFLLCMLPTSVFADEKNCPNYDQFKNEIAEFWPKFVFDIMKDVFCYIAHLSWNTFSTSLQALIAVGAGLYIAVYTLRNLSSFSQQDVAAYFSNNKTGILFLMFKIAFIFLLLSHESEVYKYLVTPIIQAGATVGQNDWGENFASVDSVDALFDKVIAQIVEFNSEAHKIIAMGRLMLCLMTLPDTIIDWHWKILPFGAVIYIFGQMIVIFLAFYMMDIIFRLGVGCVLLPFGIACGISKLTSHYTLQLWNLFINVAFNFILLKIIIDFSIEMIKYSLNFLISAKIEALLMRPLLNDADAEEFTRSLSLDAFVLLSLACIIAIKLFFDVETVAEKISNAPSVGKMGQKVGGDLAKGVKDLGLNVGKQPFKFAGAAISEASIKKSKSVQQLKRGWNWFKRHI